MNSYADDPRWIAINTQLNEAIDAGDSAAVKNARKEAYNLQAKFARKINDQLCLHLLCCVEESEKLRLENAESMFSILLAFHSLKEDGKFLDTVCGCILPALRLLLSETDHKIKLMKLERE